MTMMMMATMMKMMTMMTIMTMKEDNGDDNGELGNMVEKTVNGQLVSQTKHFLNFVLEQSLLDHGDGSLPFHRWTNGQLPLETIEKPSSLMKKTIEKPLVPMVCQTQNH